MTDIRILSCPQCGFPKIRDCGNGLYQCDDCGTYFDKNENIVQTNEEWFDGLSTEEKAKVLRRKTYGNSEDNESVEQGWVNWLKAKHEDNPPDMPNVPSWDKWLEGERTKCTYCDGSGAECNLAGKFECPKTPKTEQEWLQTATTEQLAEWIKGHMNCNFCPMNLKCEDMRDCIKHIRTWLKQTHTTEVEK